LSFGYDSLKNFIETNFALMQHHKYAYNDLESMIAWERQVYVTLLTNHIKEENEKIKLRQQTVRR
jgi:hypothetical protein